MELFYLEVNLVDHCNLNCKGCTHFSPLSEQEFADFDVFEKDLLRLSQLFDNIATLRLLGGEPLLHPDLLKFIITSRSVFPNSQICLVTNGTLLSKQKDEFWNTCQQNNILIQVTRYPINLDIPIIEATAERFQSKLEVSDKISEFYKFINLSGNSPPEIAFRQCKKMGRCTTLRDGKIYACWFPPLVDIFNNYFSEKIPVEKGNHIDIHGNINGSSILEFLSHPTPMCRWCLTDWPFVQWGISHKTIDEWVETNSFFLKKLFRIISKTREASGKVSWFGKKLKRKFSGMSTGKINISPHCYANEWEIIVAADLQWLSEGTETVEVRIGRPDGQLFIRTESCGSGTTGKWVRDGMTFFLQDVTNGLPLTIENTLDIARVNLKNIGTIDQIQE